MPICRFIVPNVMTAVIKQILIQETSQWYRQKMATSATRNPQTPTNSENKTSRLLPCHSIGRRE